MRILKLLFFNCDMCQLNFSLSICYQFHYQCSFVRHWSFVIGSGTLDVESSHSVAYQSSITEIELGVSQFTDLQFNKLLGIFSASLSKLQFSLQLVGSEGQVGVFADRPLERVNSLFSMQLTYHVRHIWYQSVVIIYGPLGQGSSTLPKWNIMYLRMVITSFIMIGCQRKCKCCQLMKSYLYVVDKTRLLGGKFLFQ